MPRLCPRHGARQGRAPGATSLSHAITPTKFARPRDDAARWGHRALPPLHTRNSHTIYTALGAHRPCPVARSRCGRARCHNRAAITHAIFARGVPPRHCPWRLATAAAASWRAVFWRIPGWNRMRGECRLRNGDCGACIRVGQRKQNRHSTSSNIRREESSEAPFPF